MVDWGLAGGGWIMPSKPHPSEDPIGHCYRRTPPVRLPGSDICQIFGPSVSIGIGHWAIFRVVSVRLVDTTSKPIRGGPLVAWRVFGTPIRFAERTFSKPQLAHTTVSCNSEYSLTLAAHLRSRTWSNLYVELTSCQLLRTQLLFSPAVALC
ncbi:hypothetical protein BV22DRAFT_904956 [Leucogyrophana mollusca]|uniref:Uncharacterized protein n=1 Tax=Leucogyrophana mollusca TaxID=85980 RepID=A0ACB8AZ31_9AGAM|nr:hypothetical protein BV22DRAFT_904956 [Leucogyrophana mollusca]